MGWLAPAFLAGLAAIGIPVVVHMIHRERRETLAFPSLMFLRKIPYQSVRRQKLRHLALLALRCFALALLALAFARPFLQRRAAAGPAGPDGREIVLLLDQSYSMAHGGRWERAQSAVRTIAGQLRTVDRLSVVTFGATARQVVPPTSDAALVEHAVAPLRPGSEPTRMQAGFRAAAQILGASERARLEIILVSDFHRFGWTPNDEVLLPARTAVRTVDVSRGESSDVAVAGVAIARARSGDRVRATITARAVNLGAAARTTDATLRLAGRPVETKRVTVPARGSAQVIFSPTAVSQTATRGEIQLEPDSQPRNDRFFFTVSEESGASALIVDPPRARDNQSLFLVRALSVADDPVVAVAVRQTGTPDPADLRGRSLVVLNEAELPAGSAGAGLRAQVRAGATLLIAPGERGLGPVPAEWRAILPASPGAIVDRGDGGRWASVDFSNALFEPFRAARADFSSVSVRRYRLLAPAESAQVIARLDDGAPLLVGRAAGSGRVLMWAASLDAAWTDLPFHALFVPLLHQLARQSVAADAARSWFVVPHVLDVDAGQTIVESPSGVRTRIAPDSTRGGIELREAGFYETRSAATAIGAGRPIAVNVDLAESDLSHLDPAEVIAAVTTRGAPGVTGTAAGEPGTARDMERRQAIWWYLLLVALVLLGVETLLSNRLSRRPLVRPAHGVMS